MKTYVTFGQDHRHVIGGNYLDKDCVAVLESESADRGRERAFELFGSHWCMEYPEFYWKQEQLKHYPRGYIEIDPLPSSAFRFDLSAGALPPVFPDAAVRDEVICTICEAGFNLDTEGGVQGEIGILPVSFCPTCKAGIMDFADQCRLPFECPKCGYMEGDDV